MAIVNSYVSLPEGMSILPMIYVHYQIDLFPEDICQSLQFWGGLKPEPLRRLCKDFLYPTLAKLLLNWCTF